MMHDGRISSESLIAPMSPPCHTAELVEAHEVSVPIPVHLLDVALGRGTGGCATLRKQVEFARATAWSACRREGLAWLKANGLDGEVDVFTEHSPGGEARWGARWFVIVGKGSASQAWSRRPAGTAPHPDELLPDYDVPAVDNWVWSDRWRDWLDVFASMEAGPDRATAHQAAVAAGEVVELRHRANPKVKFTQWPDAAFDNE